MPKLNLEQFIQKDYDRGLMTEAFRQIEDAINRLSEGRMYQKYNAASTFPTGTTQSYALGDEIPNIAPTPAGSAGSMYMVVGWKCVAAGSPGTWEEMRVLTGN